MTCTTFCGGPCWSRGFSSRGRSGGSVCGAGSRRIGAASASWVRIAATCTGSMRMGSVLVQKRGGGVVAPPHPVKALPQQSEYLLLHGIGLRQRGNAGLVQAGELGHVRHFLSDVSSATSVFGRRRVLSLVLNAALMRRDGSARPRRCPGAGSRTDSLSDPLCPRQSNISEFHADISALSSPAGAQLVFKHGLLGID